MAKFILEITLGNGAMQTSYDICRALDDVQKKIYGNSWHELKAIGEKKIRDINGNTVGFYQVVE